MRVIESKDDHIAHLVLAQRQWASVTSSAVANGYRGNQSTFTLEQEWIGERKLGAVIITTS